MDLQVTTRNAKGKKNNLRARREGKVPAILYSKGTEGRLIELDKSEFNALIRRIKPGSLSTTRFTLHLDGKKIAAIVKDIQYELTTYEVIHIDFQELRAGVAISVRVPIRCVGVAECVGIRLGGLFRQVVKKVTVRCLPEHLPEEFEVDIRDLEINQAKRLSDLAMGSGVESLMKTNEVVALIAKR